MAEKEKPAHDKPAAADKEKAAPEKPAPADKEKGGATEVAAPAKGGKGPLIFAAAAVVLAPVLSLAVAQFVLLPKLEKKLSAPVAAAADAAPAAGGDEKKDGKTAAPPTYEFANVVVNLAGTMGTRYLKTSFIVTGAKDSNLQKIFEDNKAKLTDVTLNVLSSLTLADLEEPGSKNVLREKLVGAYNQALDHKIADQIYFSDFVVQ